MTKKGFTLVELMVTITIMLIMTSVVLFNYNKFNESSLLSQFAYDMSLTIRQAQVYGVAGRETSAISATDVSIAIIPATLPYGVHFDKATLDTFSLFINTYNLTNVLQTYKFQRGIKIYKLCTITGTVTTGIVTTCSDVGGKPSLLDISFLRPDPEAIFSEDNAINANISSVQIHLSSSDGNLKKSVEVYSTGQISVK